MIRNTLLLPFVAAAIGTPLLFLSDVDLPEPAEDDLKEIQAGEIDPEKLAPSNKKFYEPEKNLTEIFNFNLTPTRIEKRWGKLTRSEVNGFKIYRTSILSGHGDQDIAGAITYHFDLRERLDRINFHGFAVDPANLIHLASSQLGFSQTKGSQHEFRPTPLGGYSGLLKLTPSTRYKGQFKVEFEVSR